MKNLTEAIKLYKKDYEDRKMNAGYGGEQHDGGYDAAMNILAAFYAGMAFEKHGEIPNFLRDYIQEAKNLEDPEYRKYLELKKKFEDT